MASEGDKRFERAFDKMLDEDEDTMRRKNANRRAAEEREAKKRSRTEEFKRSDKRLSAPSAASSGPSVPRQEADANETQSRKRSRAEEEEPRVAKTLKKGKQNDEPVNMEDEDEGEFHEAVCRIVGGSIPRNKRKRRWEEEVKRDGRGDKAGLGNSPGLVPLAC